MRIAIFGGSFNPPHIGHVEAAKAAAEELCADKLIIVPAARPPHKEQENGTPGPEERFLLTKLAFCNMDGAEVSDIELRREGIGYTVDTLTELKNMYPDAEFVLLMGADMFVSFETWKDFQRIFELSALAVFPRGSDSAAVKETIERYLKEYGGRIFEINFLPIEISSTELRTKLKNREGNNLLSDTVYEEIIKKRYYAAKPNLEWLREKAYKYLDLKRIPHVEGCEREAVRLAERWGADTGLAAEAGILHDITKKLKGPEQLILCEKYGIITDNDEKANYKLLHSKTGAAFAREKFGITDEVYSAIYWHTTGREDMSLLEKIIYIADYIEPTRSFDGVDELRQLAYEDLDSAVARGLQMSLEELSEKGNVPHINSVKALKWLIEHRN
ncbi:MAG: nicotinate (nicotinamide) nucleotide adenylyltransferase [Clostridiales bacterium]|nr:nicotinate (nicotinamide) nucleotide adenylyltransferase [Clostridiales bacterium]